jgi:hypothetical protein
MLRKNHIDSTLHDKYIEMRPHSSPKIQMWLVSRCNHGLVLRLAYQQRTSMNLLDSKNWIILLQRERMLKTV